MGLSGGCAVVGGVRPIQTALLPLDHVVGPNFLIHSIGSPILALCGGPTEE